MPPRKSDPRPAIAAQIQDSVRRDPRAQLVHKIAAAMRPDRLPEPATKKKTSNRAESSKGKRT
jgi:hypothetical protein